MEAPPPPQPRPRKHQAEELLRTMQDFTPILPDELTQHVLGLTGYQCTDPRVTRLVSLAAHKFIADISNEALVHAKQQRQRSGRESQRLVLTMEDLEKSTKEFGIHMKKPMYFADNPESSG